MSIEYMQLALLESRKARVKAPPNPWVGCVLVKDNKVISSGHTQPVGGAHAEVEALKNVNARGATAYVTLEPCSHFGQTPPCTDALINAGIKKVLIGIEDPDSKVAGNGIKALKQAGIEVTVGVLENEITKELAPYIKHRRTGLPYVVLKSALSIDGRAAAHDRTSQWISSVEARAHAHRLRAESGAIIVGSGTALADRPKLNVRSGEIPPSQPLRVIVDRSQKVQDENAFVTDLELPDLLKNLGDRGILQVLVEGGPKVLASFIEEGLFDKIVIYYGNLILGDSGISLTDGLHIPTLTKAPKLHLNSVTKLGESVACEYLSSKLSISPKLKFKRSYLE